MFLVALFASWISPYSPTAYDLDSALVAPGAVHWMGTDEQGRDVLSRLIYGSRISLSVGFVAVGLYVLIGMIVGALAGYYGGKIDILISRTIEIVMCFPTFFLILAVLAFVGPSLFNIMIVIGVTGWTGIARLVRGEFLKLRNQEFVAGIQAAGASAGRIIFRHILPNALAPVMVSASFGVASAILIESSLSFLGFGVQPPTPSWGDILSQSRDFMDIAWWLTLFPGVRNRCRHR
ncbi:MAG: ABC transporter permease [Deltaproteobacteria bacterium]|nr:ABC transporter permease [Deltaproteobacteria bacterium]